MTVFHLADAWMVAELQWYLQTYRPTELLTVIVLEQEIYEQEIEKK